MKSQQISDVIYDITTADIYKEKSDFLKYANNLSMSFNTDGISPFDSSNKSIWPIILVINELSFNER